MKIMIVGAGAIGGYIGSKLIQAGADVIFLARGQRLKQLLDKGLYIHSPLGDSNTHVIARENPDANITPKILVFACRALALESALTPVQACIQDDTRILPFLNGVKHIKFLQFFSTRTNSRGYRSWCRYASRRWHNSTSLSILQSYCWIDFYFY